MSGVMNSFLVLARLISSQDSARERGGKEECTVRVRDNKCGNNQSKPSTLKSLPCNWRIHNPHVRLYGSLNTCPSCFLSLCLSLSLFLSLRGLLPSSHPTKPNPALRDRYAYPSSSPSQRHPRSHPWRTRTLDQARQPSPGVRSYVAAPSSASRLRSEPRARWPSRACLGCARARVRGIRLGWW